jgi:pyruvyltransferase
MKKYNPLRKIYTAGCYYKTYAKAIIKNNGIFAYWAAGKNFGDELTPIILKHYGYSPVLSGFPKQKTFLPTPESIQTELVSVGSIMHKIPDNYNGIILGTGMGNVKRTLPHATILGLRGEITKRNLGIDYDVVLGDPGLLVSLIFPQVLEKEWELGIVPHFTETDDPIILAWGEKHVGKVKIIDPRRKPHDVISDIKRCKIIISSSLHGLVTADSYDIPNQMFAIRRNRPEIYDLKYHDYYSALGMPFQCFNATGEEEFDQLINNTSSKFSSANKAIQEIDGIFKNLSVYLNKNRSKN